MYWVLAKTCLFIDVYILLLFVQRNVCRNQICKSCNKSLTSLTLKLRNSSQLLSMQLTPLLPFESVHNNELILWDTKGTPLSGINAIVTVFSLD